MSDQGDESPVDVSRRFPPLPRWLEERLLKPGEPITWVRGPRFCPFWERYATHPAFFLFALAGAALCLGVGRLLGGSWSAMPILPGLAAVAILVGSVFVLAISAAYFTRLVVTDDRVFIVQGYEVCRNWSLEELPRSLIRYRLGPDGERSRTVDLDALKKILGGASDKFAEARSIRALGKHLDQIKAQEE